jgi:diguanylate cyclase (GGDEF)-like protein
MLQLIEHIIRISSKRDRTEITTALVDAMQDIFDPPAFAVYRCYPGLKQAIVFRCAGLDAGGRFSHNAYLPERRHCQPIDHDPLLLRCQNEGVIVRETSADGADRLVFPIVADKRPLYLIDISLPAGFPADRRVLLMGLVEYFGHHISLLDYGEADTLTGLANRKTFDKHLFEVLGQTSGDDIQANATAPRRRHRGSNLHHWLAICDVDHFKRINDVHGHLTGDTVLVTLSQLMRETFRYDDQLFRFGGEEFIVVLQPASAEDAASALARFRVDVEQHKFVEVGRVTVSVGYCHLLPNDTPTATIDRADAALYWAKRNGRNRIVCFDTLAASGALSAPDQ